MTYDFYGQRTEDGTINPLVDYLSSKDFESWDYMGMNVELDPTVDYNNQNVLIRWTETEEGFNDKIIVHSLEEFKEKFEYKEAV